MIDLRADAEAIHFWWHSIDLGGGIVTRGAKRPRSLAAELAALRLPDLTGSSVLDVGAWDGFFSFEAERRGAARVVALDHFAWRQDLDSWGLERARRDRRRMSPWHPEGLIGKRGFDLARYALASRVESVVADFTTTDPEPLGTFDVVLFLGVLYHLDDPLAALRRLRRVTRRLAVIESQASALVGVAHPALPRLVDTGALVPDPANWWAPSVAALEELCREAGFGRVSTVSRPPAGQRPASRGGHRRHVVHAMP